MNSPLMTQAEYARHRGVSPPAVSNWKAQGLLHFAEDPDRPGKVKVDVARTDARVNAKIDPMRGRPAGAMPAPAAAVPAQLEEGGDSRGGAESAASVRMELARENLITQRLKNADTARELAPRVELERRAMELGRVARERMHAMFRSLAERLAAERDIRVITALGEAEIDRIFAELADAAEAGEFAPDDGEDDADDLPDDAIDAEAA